MTRRKSTTILLNGLAANPDCISCFQGIIEMILFGSLGCFLVRSMSCSYRHHNSNNNSGNVQTAQNHHHYYGNVSFGPVFVFGGASRGISSSSINNIGDAKRTAASVPAVQYVLGWSRTLSAVFHVLVPCDTIPGLLGSAIALLCLSILACQGSASRGPHI